MLMIHASHFPKANERKRRTEAKGGQSQEANHYRFRGKRAIVVKLARQTEVGKTMEGSS